MSDIRQRPHLLVIAEKPSLMRKIQDVYSKNTWNFDLSFTCARGHILQFKEPDKDIAYGFAGLPIFPSKWEYVVTNKEVLKQIKDALKQNKLTGVIHAGDPDAEGEVLVREIIDYLKVKLPVYRFFTNDVTENAIRDALLNLKPLNTPLFDNLYNSGLVRAKLDWMVGMNFSRGYSDKLKQSVSVGRVMTVILNIIVKRDLEIENYKDEINYGVSATFNYNGETFKGTLIESDGKPARFETKEEASKFTGGRGVVVKSEKKIQAIKPDSFYNLSLFQAETSKYGLSLETSEKILQSLYQKEYVTYPRTDCEVLNGTEDLSKPLECAALYFKETPKKDKILGDKKYIDPVKFSKAGHSAIIPTGVVPKNLTKEEEFVYKLICRRFLSAFLFDCQVEKKGVLIKSGDNLYKAEGMRVVEEGFKSIYEENVYPKNAKDLPALKTGDEADFTTEVIELHKPKPSLYTIGTLIEVLDNPLRLKKDIKDTKEYKELKDLEKFRIGTPASRLNIIPKLVSKGYIKVNNGKYTSTKQGRDLCVALNDDPISDVLLTGEWELNLTKIREGDLSPDVFESGVKSQIVEELEKIKGKTYKTVGGEDSQWICPLCGKVLQEKRLTLNCECGFLFWKKTWGKQMSNRQISRILGGEKIELKGLKFPNGNKGSGIVYLQDGKLKTDFK